MGLAVRAVPGLPPCCPSRCGSSLHLLRTAGVSLSRVTSLLSGPLRAIFFLTSLISKLVLGVKSHHTLKEKGLWRWATFRAPPLWTLCGLREERGADGPSEIAKGAPIMVSNHRCCSVVPTLCDPTDCSPPGSSVHGLLQARVWSGLPFPSPGIFPDHALNLGLLDWQADP